MFWNVINVILFFVLCFAVVFTLMFILVRSYRDYILYSRKNRRGVYKSLISRKYWLGRGDIGLGKIAINNLKIEVADKDDGSKTIDILDIYVVGKVNGYGDYKTRGEDYDLWGDIVLIEAVSELHGTKLALKDSFKEIFKEAKNRIISYSHLKEVSDYE